MILPLERGDPARVMLPLVKSWGESRAIPLGGTALRTLSPGWATPAPRQRRAVPAALTRAAVELAGLGDVPFAQTCPLADGGPNPVHVVLGQDGVEEDAPGARGGRG